MRCLYKKVIKVWSFGVLHHLSCFKLPSWKFPARIDAGGTRDASASSRFTGGRGTLKPCVRLVPHFQANLERPAPQ